MNNLWKWWDDIHRGPDDHSTERNKLISIIVVLVVIIFLLITWRWE